MNINRGNQFDYLVSMSTKSRGLKLHAIELFGIDHPKAKQTYKNGDVNSSLIRTVNGEVIVLGHNTDSPRPYSRINLVQGTKGTFCDYPPRIFLDGQGNHAWQPIDAFKADYEHPLWRDHGALARKLGGHGGMDFIMNYRLVQLYRQGRPPEMDVYDAAAWSAPGPLSDISVAWGNLPLPFPDFTRGHWQQPVEAAAD